MKTTSIGISALALFAISVHTYTTHKFNNSIDSIDAGKNISSVMIDRGRNNLEEADSENGDFQYTAYQERELLLKVIPPKGRNKDIVDFSISMN